MRDSVDFNSILSLIDRTISPTYLNPTQEIVLREVWNGKTYSRMADDYNYDPEYIKTVGCNLWQVLSNAFNEQINKSNFVPFMRQKINELLSTEDKKKSINLNSEVLLTDFADYQQHPYQWTTAPNTENFIGREKQIKLLESWNQDSDCNCILVSGMVGCGKTSLITKFAKNIQNQFDHIIWLSLNNPPSISTLINYYLKIINQNLEQYSDSNLELANQDLSYGLSQLVNYLKEKKVLLILDDLQSILEVHQTNSWYKPEFESYGHLLRSVISTNHQSLLICASRVKPRLLEYYDINQVKILDLSGWEKTSINKFIDSKSLNSIEKQKLLDLSESLQYNPQLLKIIDAHWDVFSDEQEELEQIVQELSFLEGIVCLLEQELSCLSKLEQEIIFWLAISSEPITQEKFIYSQSKIKLRNSIKSLEKRSLIVQNNCQYFLMPIMKSYVRRKLVKQALSGLS
ncbi:MAG: NB-ARC domain-containing protein [Pleurocapsa sp.]